MVTIRMPLSSAILAKAGALRCARSQPMRILSVTGTSTARAVDCRMAAAAQAARHSAAPAGRPLAPFMAGPPQMMSIRSAPRPTAILAASAIAAGSQPASWTAFGPSALTWAMRKVAAFSRTIAQDAIISDTTSPAPRLRASLRNGRSVTPDIGARMTGQSSVREPLAIGFRVGGLPSRCGKKSKPCSVQCDAGVPATVDAAVARWQRRRGRSGWWR